MSNVTMNSIVLNYGDSPLVGALRVLANSEKRRAEHARQSFDYDGKVVWDNGLNPPFVALSPAPILALYIIRRKRKEISDPTDGSPSSDTSSKRAR
jgi:hypothetical protein